MMTPEERLQALAARLDQQLRADPDHPGSARMRRDIDRIGRLAPKPGRQGKDAVKR